ncbi:ribosome-binding factor A [Salinisphaera orenii MK-B5]|uniref:Ribosome-binding factor A n=1 Tax=Salinisphaera orenii MK-B5 TaxID=856730 RepID=A0A423PRV4_9GAMM|nr:30S ribosome-binding factor RbfA [Salinisphaera orenii]ROO28335.1 ribosome-binding factor A [Salinisphaera orenii MK-B5]
MPREFARKHRVAEEIKRELGVLITTQVKDPRVRLATITDVDLSPDLKHAKVFVGAFDVTASSEPASEVLAGLRAARGFLKRELGKRLRLRTMPDLRFYEDATEREAQRLTRIIDDAVAEDTRHDVDEDAPPRDGSA